VQGLRRSIPRPFAFGVEEPLEADLQAARFAVILMYKALPYVKERSLHGKYFRHLPFGYHEFLWVSTIFVVNLSDCAAARRFLPGRREQTSSFKTSKESQLGCHDSVWLIGLFLPILQTIRLAVCCLWIVAIFPTH
jgi:hypothetical protein